MPMVQVVPTPMWAEAPSGVPAGSNARVAPFAPNSSNNDGAAALGSSAVIGSAAQGAATAVNAMYSTAQKAEGVYAGGKKAATAIVNQAKAFKADPKAFLHELKTYVESLVKRQINSYVERVVDLLPGIAKDFLEDPDMPRWVSSGKDNLVDAAWPDVREEIMWEVAVLLAAQKKDVSESGQGVNCCLAFFRYHMFPYDKTFWGCLRDPWYVLFLLISLIPLYSVSPLFFLFIFIIIDKSETFQLTSFILGFKGTQFITVGILRFVVGFITYIRCVTVEAHEQRHTCDENGPGGRGAIWPTLLAFACQVVLIWVANALLYCSKEKGRAELKEGVLSVEHTGEHVKGGYIRYLVWYDLVVAIVCAGACAAVILLRIDDHEANAWTNEQLVFAGQAVYGLLSLPFFFFWLPVFNRILTHCYPTAYDRNGCCRKPVSPAEPKEEKASRAIEEGQGDMDMQQVKDMLADIKSKLGSGLSELLPLPSGSDSTGAG